MTRRRALPVLIAAILLTITVPTTAGFMSDNPVERALDQAAELYDDGHLVRSMRWLERARELMAQEMALTGHGADDLPSNAAELLHYLDIYGAYAYGANAEHDAAYEFLVDQLSLVLAIETDDVDPDFFSDLRVSTWASGQVHRVGDVNFSHWASGRIHRVGDLNISYRADGRPDDIGGIDYSYHMDSPWPQRVGDVDLHE
ncbi:MAG: hypothetical protein GY838_17130 [bacterium]|nr:hypothetical protein [bacterium]